MFVANKGCSDPGVFLFVANKGCSGQPAAPPNSSAIHSGRGTTPYAPSQCCTARYHAVATRELRGGHAATTAAAEQPDVVRSSAAADRVAAIARLQHRSSQHRNTGRCAFIYLRPYPCVQCMANGAHLRDRGGVHRVRPEHVADAVAREVRLLRQHLRAPACHASGRESTRRVLPHIPGYSSLGNSGGTLGYSTGTHADTSTRPKATAHSGPRRSGSAARH